jgi:hypothetical protein
LLHENSGDTFSPTQFGLCRVLAALLATFFGMIFPSSKVDDFSVKTSAASVSPAAKPETDANQYSTVSKINTGCIENQYTPVSKNVWQEDITNLYNENSYNESTQREKDGCGGVKEENDQLTANGLQVAADQSKKQHADLDPHSIDDSLVSTGSHPHTKGDRRSPVGSFPHDQEAHASEAQSLQEAPAAIAGSLKEAPAGSLKAPASDPPKTFTLEEMREHALSFLEAYPQHWHIDPKIKPGEREEKMKSDWQEAWITFKTLLRAGVDPTFLIASAGVYAEKMRGKDPRHIQTPKNWLWDIKKQLGTKPLQRAMEAWGADLVAPEPDQTEVAALMAVE